ncbi:protease modulator HflC [uncultured Abyssibacter sp.]|uniref:protease modulator HflC n=1 Tax=uncultured Abyssibacter sp. TaxID=2320202 RepID=UPI0032B22F04
MSGKQLFLLVIVLLAAFLALDSVFVVDQREKVLVFQLGQIKRSDSEPGLHFKLPLVQNVRSFDSRVLTLDADAEEYLTLEKKNVKVDFYVKWRIADVAQYYRATSGLESNALSRLSSIINQGLRDEFGNRTIRQAVSGERNDIMRSMEANAAEKIAEFGIDLVDVRIKRIDLPDDVSDSVYNRMRSERQRVAADFRARGAEEAEKIRAAAERERQVMLAEAYREAEEHRGRGDAEAAAIYANVYGEDTEFYNFYRSLDVYRTGFQGRSDVLVLEPDSELFRYFKNGADGR